MRILLVEDDTHTAAFIAKGLREDGHAVDHASDGKQGLFLASTEPYDALVLDRMLPGLDGITLLRTLRGAGNPLPILLLTALGDTDHRVEGLRAGADDYLVKPFALSELVARIEAILRRSSGGKKRQLKVADLVYDLDTLDITRADQPLKLNPLTMKLLAILMQKSPAVVRREALEEALWGDDSPDSDSLRSHIHQLRQVIDKPFATPLLHTLHGVGYRLADKDNEF